MGSIPLNPIGWWYEGIYDTDSIASNTQECTQ